MGIRKAESHMSDTCLVTATHNGKPWMVLRSTHNVSNSDGKIMKAHRRRLSEVHATFLKPGFGLILEAGPAGLEFQDFNPMDLDNLRPEFGCVVVRGVEGMESQEDMARMAESYGFPLP